MVNAVCAEGVPPRVGGILRNLATPNLPRRESNNLFIHAHFMKLENISNILHLINTIFVYIMYLNLFLKLSLFGTFCCYKHFAFYIDGYIIKILD